LNFTPGVVSLAALRLAELMLGAAITHIRRNEPPMIGVTLVLFALAAFVAWGRFGPAPFTSWRSGAENHDAVQRAIDCPTGTLRVVNASRRQR